MTDAEELALVDASIVACHASLQRVYASDTREWGEGSHRQRTIDTYSAELRELTKRRKELLATVGAASRRTFMPIRSIADA